MARLILAGVLLALFSASAGCSGDVHPAPCRSYCGRDCPTMLEEMAPDDRTGLQVTATSSAVEELTRDVLASDPDASVRAPLQRHPDYLSVEGSRAAVEVLCESELTSSVEEEVHLVPH